MSLRNDTKIDFDNQAEEIIEPENSDEFEKECACKLDNYKTHKEGCHLRKERDVIVDMCFCVCDENWGRDWNKEHDGMRDLKSFKKYTCELADLIRGKTPLVGVSDGLPKYTVPQLKQIEQNMPNYPCASSGENEDIKCRRCLLLWIERFPDEVRIILAKQQFSKESNEAKQ